MAHGFVKIEKFVDEIKEGDYVIPHFQRDFDWKPNQVCELFNSILNEYYAGTILLWALEDKDRELKMWDSLWGTDKSEKPTKAILDGQQRLSSIFYALSAPKKSFPHKQAYYYFFIDLDKTFQGNEDESIIYKIHRHYHSVKSFLKEKENLINHGLFPLCLLTDNEFMKSTEYEKWIQEYAESRKKELEINSFQVTRKIEGILKYQFLTETLEKKEPKEICTIFANINSKGLRLSVFDLMNAFLYPKEIHLRKEWENLDYEELKQIGSDMKVQLLKLMSLYKQNYCSSTYLYNLIPGSTIKDRQGNISILIKNKEEFNKLWQDAAKYSEKARKKIMNSGLGDFGAIKSLFIPNTTIIPVMGALLKHYESNPSKKIDERKFWQKIEKWYWCAVISGDYSGSSDSIMAKDYRELKEWFKDDTKIPDRISQITSTYIEDRLNLLKAKHTNNSRYCAVLNLLALKSAKDFYNGRQLGTYPSKEINDHHIFPKKSKIKISSEKMDCILNRTLIFDETNNKIKNKTPKDYYEEIIEKIGGEKKAEEMMSTHFINSKSIKFLKENDFNGFIKEREKTIKNEIKKILGITSTEERNVIIPGHEYDNENKYLSYIEDSEEFIYIIDPYFRENSLRLISKGLKNNNSIKEVKIIMKLHTIDEDFKNAFKKFSTQMKNEKEIESEIRVITESKTSSKLHNRYLITKNKSFDFVSADTVSRGQLSHIKEIDDIKPLFEEFWKQGKNLLQDWNKIIASKK